MGIFQKNTDLKNLFSKYIKTTSKLEKEREEVAKRTKSMLEIEQQSEGLQKEIFKEQASNYYISFDILREVLKKTNTLKVNQIDEILYTLLKYSKNKVELSKNKLDSYLEVWACTCEGRLNICYSEGDEPPSCPIVHKAYCNGDKMDAIFLKKGNNNESI